MTDSTASLPPSVDRVLRRFRAMEREEKMQALLAYAKRLEPLPERLAQLDRAEFTVPECQTRVDIVPEVHDGLLHFYADVNVRQSPTIAAFLSHPLQRRERAAAVGDAGDSGRLREHGHVEHRPGCAGGRAGGDGPAPQAVRRPEVEAGQTG